MIQKQDRGYFFSRGIQRVMAIVNITPDSFFEDDRFLGSDDIIEHCEKIIDEGADIIDIGAFSSRLNCDVISEEEEKNRLLPALKKIRTAFPDIAISIDTFRKNIAECAISEGADIINDISGGTFDDEMIPFIGKNEIPFVMMHVGSSIENLHKTTVSGNITSVVKDFFEGQLHKISYYGNPPVILDPGIGFNKSMDDNFTLLSRINEYRVNNLPVLIGISRKSIIYKILCITPKESLNGTTVLNTTAVLSGADILRVHDVKEAVETIKLTTKIKKI